MMKKILSMLMLLVLATTASAEQTPTQVLTEAVEGLIAAIVDPNLSQAQKKATMAKIIDEKVDFEAMSQRIIGPEWRSTSDGDKAQFKALFAKIVTNTYFTLLEKYTDEKVQYGEEKIERDRFASVDITVVSGDTQTPVRFLLIKNPDSGWLIFDYKVEGVSMVRSYSTSYKTALRKGKMPALIAQLKEELAAAQ